MWTLYQKRSRATRGLLFAIFAIGSLACALSQADASPLEALEDERAFLLAVQKPQVVASGDSYAVVGFKTGPNAYPYEYDVRCYSVADQTAEALTCAELVAAGGTPVGESVRGYLPLSYSKISVNVTGFDEPAVDCFVKVNGPTGKKSKCSYAGRAIRGRQPTSVLFSLRYIGLDSSTFDQNDKDLVCTNIGLVQPGGTCNILSVLPGSAVVTGTVAYPSEEEATTLVQDLKNGTAATTLAQGTWNSGSTPTVVTEAAEAEPTPSKPKIPDPPTDVAMVSYNETSLDVSFTPPVDLSGILGYTVTCTPVTKRRSLLTAALSTTVVKTGSSTNFIRVTPLSSEMLYKCEVQSLTVDEASAVAASSLDVMTATALATERVIAGDQWISISATAYTPPTGASIVGYQVQCLTGSTTVCQPQATGAQALQPATPSSVANTGLALSGLTNDASYQCFSVASYTLNGQTSYACSGPFEAKPFAQPTVSTVVFGDQQVSIAPSDYTLPTDAIDAKYQVQCRANSSTVCDPLDVGTAALQPNPAVPYTTSQTVTGLTNGVGVKCFAVVTYTLGSSGTKYTCSDPVDAVATTAVPTLETTNVIAGTQKITVTPNVFSGPEGATNVTYQVQCPQGALTSCNPAGSLFPNGTGLSTPAPIVVDSLQDRTGYSCFSVISYSYGETTAFSCSSVVTATPFTEPTILTASDVSSVSATSADVVVSAYTGLITAANFKYQAQCLPSNATVCDPTITSGAGALAPSTASVSDGTFTVQSLTNGTTYQCFKVISYTMSGDLKYTCSPPYEYAFSYP